MLTNNTRAGLRITHKTDKYDDLATDRQTDKNRFLESQSTRLKNAFLLALSSLHWKRAIGWVLIVDHGDA